MKSKLQKGWAIDTSTGRGILTYDGCIVIKDEDVKRVMKVMASHTTPSEEIRTTTYFMRDYLKHFIDGAGSNYISDLYINKIADRFDACIFCMKEQEKKIKTLKESLLFLQQCNKPNPIRESKEIEGNIHKIQMVYESIKFPMFARKLTKMFEFIQPIIKHLCDQTQYIDDLKNENKNLRATLDKNCIEVDLDGREI